MGGIDSIVVLPTHGGTSRKGKYKTVDKYKEVTAAVKANRNYGVTKYDFFDTKLLNERLIISIDVEGEDETCTPLHQELFIFSLSKNCKNATFSSVLWDVDDEILPPTSDAETKSVWVSVYRGYQNISCALDGTTIKSNETSKLLLRREVVLSNKVLDSDILEKINYAKIAYALQRWV